MWDASNQIDPSARISPHVIMGKYNEIGADVVIEGYKGEEGPISIGDCNRIGPGTRILAGRGGFSLGDWGVIHNDVLMLGELRKSIGHNFWVGQNTILDSTGGLEIGDGVRIGASSQVWTHVASGELIEGCMLAAARRTVLEDDVWLVGSCVVGSGLRLGRRSVCLIESNVTRSTAAGCVYAGSPARLHRMQAWKPVTLEGKLAMMRAWAREFASNRPDVTVDDVTEEVWILSELHQVAFGPRLRNEPGLTSFDLSTKRYTKRLTQLERDVYRFLYGHKARFVPVVA